MERSQVTSRVLMVRPSGFARNAETAGTNAFMHDVSAAGAGGEGGVRSRALAEFERVVGALRGAGVEVAVDDDPALALLPDAVFPNNWFTTHALADGGRRAITYPMLAPSRRRERRVRAFDVIREAWGIEYPERVRLEVLEEGDDRAGGFLEGTGSLVLDRVRGVVFAVRSPRTCAGALEAFARATGYRVVAFDASVCCEDGSMQAIYHTNVMMTMGRTLAIWCPESVPEAGQREMVRSELVASGREVVAISAMQMNAFAGNVLQLSGSGGGGEGDVLAMSTRAFEAFTVTQRDVLMRHGRIVHVAIPTIEDIGGGGVRCMLAEVFG